MCTYQCLLEWSAIIAPAYVISYHHYSHIYQPLVWRDRKREGEGGRERRESGGMMTTLYINYNTHNGSREDIPVHY